MFSKLVPTPGGTETGLGEAREGRPVRSIHSPFEQRNLCFQGNSHILIGHLTLPGSAI